MTPRRRRPARPERLQGLDQGWTLTVVDGRVDGVAAVHGDGLAADEGAGVGGEEEGGPGDVLRLTDQRDALSGGGALGDKGAKRLGLLLRDAEGARQQLRGDRAGADGVGADV